MTLSPVFRSPGAVQLLREQGIWERLGPAILSQGRAVARVHQDLEEILDPRFQESANSLRDGIPGADGGAATDPRSLSFLQEYFFLILFRSLFEELGVPPRRLERYAEINFCVKGTITAADNIFDDQEKSLLPLKAGDGSRFLSILQLMCFERLIRRALDRGVEGGELNPEDRDEVLRGLLDMMARIGLLEGSEEGGVDEIPPPDLMVERVHRVRGGALFALAFVAPQILEEGSVRRRVQEAEPAVARLGTAFQIVDDLTDFEFDLGRRSHNLLVSHIHHHGTAKEKERLRGLLNGGSPEAGVVERSFRDSARAVLERAHAEALASFEALAELGFWFPPELAPEVVHAIVGLDGVGRMSELSATPTASPSSAPAS